MIAIVDYGIQKNNTLINLLSEHKIDFKVTHSESDIISAEKIILPDAGNITSAIKQLHMRSLFTMLRLCNKPMLGISLGMHLMSAYTKDGNLSCLGIFPGVVKKLDQEKRTEANSDFRGTLVIKESKLFKNMLNEEKFFFDNSLYLPVDQYTSAVVGHIPIFSAAMEKDNFFGVQFLPEKSGESGLKILQNFLSSSGWI